MAMVVLASPFVAIEGRIGSEIWRYDVCGQHVQSAPRFIHHEATVKQIIRRKAFRLLRTYIKIHATPYFAGVWQDYANKHPRRGRKGKTYFLAWWAMFISFNINRVIAGKKIKEFPPGYS